MAKGIIYCMTTIVPGLVKIGKTGSDNFEARMYQLEHNGYSNVVGLQRHFAIEVEDYSEKERLIDDIFSKSRVGSTELFSIDINLAVQLLSSLDGTQIYPAPADVPKEIVFDEATDQRSINCIPDGDYFMKYTPQGGKSHNATLRKSGSQLTLCKGGEIRTGRDKIVVASWRAVRNSASIANGIVVKDIPCTSLSMAASLVTGGQANGWDTWKTSDGKAVDSFRNSDEE